MGLRAGVIDARFRGLKRWDEGRGAEGSLIYTLLYWGLFPIPYLPSCHLLSPLIDPAGVFWVLRMPGAGVLTDVCTYVSEAP